MSGRYMKEVLFNLFALFVLNATHKIHATLKHLSCVFRSCATSTFPSHFQIYFSPFSRLLFHFCR
jgi:hypothetical protein